MSQYHWSKNYNWGKYKLTNVLYQAKMQIEKQIISVSHKKTRLIRILEGLAALIQGNTSNKVVWILRASFIAKQKAHGVNCTQKYDSFLMRKTMNLDDYMARGFVLIAEMMYSPHWNFFSRIVPALCLRSWKRTLGRPASFNNLSNRWRKWAGSR